MNTPSITHPQLVAALAKPGADILASLTPQKCHLWHMACCIPGEAAELLEGMVLFLRDKGSLDTINITEELGDIEFYLEGFRGGFGFAYVPSAGRLVDIEDALFRIIQHSGQLFDLTKKHVIYGKVADLPALAKALSDMEQALADLRTTVGITRQETLDANIAKLSKRYASVTGGIGYSDKAAQERADKIPYPDSIHNPENVAEGLLPVGYRFGTWAETGTYYQCKFLEQPVKMWNCNQNEWVDVLCQGAPNRTYAVPIAGPDSSKNNLSN